MKRAVAWAAVALLLAGAIPLMVLLGRSLGAPAPARQAPLPPLRWDLSEPRAPAAIGWPRTLSPDVWFPDGPRELHLLLPKGREATYTFDSAQVRQEGNRVRTVELLLPVESLDAAYRRAVALDQEWHLRGREKLDAWYARRKWDETGYQDPEGAGCEVERRGTFPAYGISAVRLFGRPLRWRVVFRVGFFPSGSAPLAPAAGRTGG